MIKLPILSVLALEMVCENPLGGPPAGTTMPSAAAGVQETIPPAPSEHGKNFSKFKPAVFIGRLFTLVIMGAIVTESIRQEVVFAGVQLRSATAAARST